MRNGSLKRILLVILAVLALCGGAGCGQANNTTEAEKMTYKSISAEEAKKIMDEQEGYLIVDVRRDDEYAQGHVPGAILVPNETIREKAEESLPDKDQLLLVYCRSGRRSKEASAVLAELGYSNVMEFGGIIDWPYEIEK